MPENETTEPAVDVAVDQNPVEFTLCNAWNAYCDLPEDQQTRKEAMSQGWNSAAEFIATSLHEQGFEAFGRVVRENFKYYGTMGE